MIEEKNYTERDLEASLRRAFVEGKADFIPFDGHTARNGFLRDGINYGQERGWLDEGKEINEEQWTTIEYRLTEKGKKYFGLN